MKTLIASIITLSSLSAFAAWPIECKQYEAQFIGTVSKLKVYENHFTFQVQPTRFESQSVVCPLSNVANIEDAVLAYPGKPSIKNGDEISGVMVYDVASDSFKID